MITITSLTHPTMIAKVRAALKDAAMGKGHLHGGHANRVYVQNRKGHNILRIGGKAISLLEEKIDSVLADKPAKKEAPAVKQSL